MKKSLGFVLTITVFTLIFLSLRVHSTHGQISQPATTGMVAPIARGSGAPGSTLTCNAASAYLLFWDLVANQISGCDGMTWQTVLGAVGATGLTGATGTAGTNGATGTTGAAGSTGSIGSAGAIGSTGAQGSTGATGATYLKGTTGTITGTLLAAAGFDSGTATVAGATAGMPCGDVNATDGTIMGSFVLKCFVTGSGSNNVTVTIMSPVIGTPPTKSYNFVVFP